MPEHARPETNTPLSVMIRFDRWIKIAGQVALRSTLSIRRPRDHMAAVGKVASEGQS
ncbi:hypothetical protein GR183_16500 [Stappia sp. GBMRC 2046]|uniref:Uncharacterized protein n=1 Tax=Stappia sediminis TaxID=2692190 RepID=A0A7X3LWU2_9HYPH|nr:hypothetical protein [Stappia sediminis]MXN66517.1 hypothetical protein [Stappia sediminis]